VKILGLLRLALLAFRTLDINGIRPMTARVLSALAVFAA